MRINVKIEGISALLFNKFNPSETKGKKTVLIYSAEDDAEKSLYKDDKGNVCTPSLHLEAAMIKSAVSFKMKGRKTYKDVFKSGLTVEPELIKHKDNEYELYTVPVVIQRSRVVKSRAMKKKWGLDFVINIIDEESLTPAVVKTVLENAGKYIGIGDWRPKFGRFKIVEFKADKK